MASADTNPVSCAPIHITSVIGGCCVPVAGYARYSTAMSSVGCVSPSTSPAIDQITSCSAASWVESSSQIWFAVMMEPGGSAVTSSADPSTVVCGWTAVQGGGDDD